MGKRRHTVEVMFAKLRQVDARTVQGRTEAEAARQIGMAKVTYYCYGSVYDDLKPDQVRRLNRLETEDARLPWPLPGSALEKLILNGVISGPEGQRQQN